MYFVAAFIVSCAHCYQVVNILESRARSIEVSKHRYYDLLYAFHVKRSNYRKGETVFISTSGNHC